ncbi:MAG TPA: DUF1801 domain-containing protein [Gemmataceae bacterium]|jgi:uncharacterized protein YdhG (YjbR/CyaY superfamily)|nr:DUF1801 domain-containing protein [Gemmataceae bacterium]
MPAKPKTFDDYLAALSDDKRAALEIVRKAVHAAAPGAEEYIGYGLAVFRLNGKPLVALGAGANHCAFYPMSGKTVEAHQDLLSQYDTSKGTIRFPATKPLPAALVRKLVKARIAENDGQGAKTKPKKQADKTSTTRTDPEVDAWMTKLRHPRKSDLEALRQLLLGVSSTIQEGFKWNSPSFRTADYFATINVSGKDFLRLILHTGAKAKGMTMQGSVADPAGLVHWLSKDRGMVTIDDTKDLTAKRKAVVAIIRDWVRLL